MHGDARWIRRVLPAALLAAALCGGGVATPGLALEAASPATSPDSPDAGPVIPTPETPTAPDPGTGGAIDPAPTKPDPADPDSERPDPGEPGTGTPESGEGELEPPHPPTSAVPPGESELGEAGGAHPETVPTPPNETVRPGTVAVAGTPRVGERLHARLDGWGAAGARFSYQWQRGGAALRGATADHYTPVAADRGERLSVTVTVRRDGVPTRTVASPVTETVTAGQLVARRPSIAGTPTVGATLTASSPAWAPATTRLSTQWLRDGVAIPHATAEHYRLTAADAGAAVSVTVTGELTGYTIAAETSAATTPVLRTLAGAPVPRISGSPQIGTAVRVRTGDWALDGVDLALQWCRNGAPIPGATAHSYAPSGADAGSVLTVTVTGTKPGYAPVTKTSAGAPVLSELRVPQPWIRGGAGVGGVLTVERCAWPAATVPRFQWFRGASPIPGATAAHYVPGPRDAGFPLRVLVRGERAGHTSDARITAPVRIARTPAPDRLSDHAE